LDSSRTCLNHAQNLLASSQAAFMPESQFHVVRGNGKQRYGPLMLPRLLPSPDWQLNDGQVQEALGRVRL